LPEIEVKRRGGVAVVTLNAPERRNALTPAMARLFCEACDAIDADGEIGAAVVVGAHCPTPSRRSARFTRRSCGSGG
jgi:enoyl-CoA hydratase